MLNSSTALAALPFVTDDAPIANRNQLAIEYFAERWNLPAKGDQPADIMLGQYLGLSYGLTNNLEATIGGLVAHDYGQDSTSYMNPIFQLKTTISRSTEHGVPSFSVSMGYVDQHGRGQYFDPATNAYLMGIATTRFFDDGLLIHVNAGPKASYNLPTNRDYYRMQLGVGADMQFFRKDVRLLFESYNGTPNSPRDSPGFFHSYQVGVKWLESDSLSFDILYGNQPTFMGYDESFKMLHRRTSWVQFGIRKVIDDVF